MKYSIIIIPLTFLILTACTSQSELESNQQSNPTEETIMDQTPATNLEINDIELGSGEEASSGATVTVHYTGTLTDGTKFDSSLDRGQPFSFQLGAGEVIPGWDQGVAGMKVGGKRVLIIPPDLAYGNRALPGIPAGSTLQFEVELLEVN